MAALNDPYMAALWPYVKWLVTCWLSGCSRTVVNCCRLLITPSIQLLVRLVVPSGLMFYLCYLFLNAFFSLLAVRSQNWWMDSLWICYEKMGIWYNFYIPWLDFSPRLPIFREMGKLHQFLPKIWRCPHLLTCLIQTTQHMKTGK